jgi:hypothetical protein
MAAKLKNGETSIGAESQKSGGISEKYPAAASKRQRIAAKMAGIISGSGKAAKWRHRHQ